MKRLLMFTVLCLSTSNVYAGIICTFEGSADLSQKTWNLKADFKDNGSFDIHSQPLTQGHYLVKASLRHLKTPLFDISSDLVAKVEEEKTDSPWPSLKGSIESQYSLVNYKPARELSGRFKMREGRLTLEKFSWGGIIIDGTIGMVPPFDLGLTAKLVEIALDEFTTTSQCPAGSSHLSGYVSGRVDLNGVLDRIVLKGNLLAYDGYLRAIFYDSLSINFDGLYPMVRIRDSIIRAKGGLSFNLEGNLELGKECNILGGLSALKLSPVIEEGDLRREWTIKRKPDGNSGATEFKYRLQKPTNQGAASKDEADMLSVEHSIKF